MRVSAQNAKGKKFSITAASGHVFSISSSKNTEGRGERGGGGAGRKQEEGVLQKGPLGCALLIQFNRAPPTDSVFFTEGFGRPGCRVSTLCVEKLRWFPSTEKGKQEEIWKKGL